MRSEARVSDSSAGNGRPRGPSNARGVLDSLPNTRPQRASARRDAARAAAGSAVAVSQPSASAGPATKRAASKREAAKPSPPKPLASKRSTPKATAASHPAASKRPPAKPARAPAPRQGYEADGDPAPGVALRPPNGPELLVSVVDLVGEFAAAGLTGGARALKGALSRLPGL